MDIVVVTPSATQVRLIRSLLRQLVQRLLYISQNIILQLRLIAMHERMAKCTGNSLHQVCDMTKYLTDKGIEAPVQNARVLLT